jgi:hypothetical protein
VHGISAAIAPTMVAEMGTDMRQWRNEKHCCSWRGLAPKHAIAGGKGRQSRPMKHRNRAAHTCRMAAQSGLRAHCALGAVYHRGKGRLGPAQALVATAHKMARTGYHRRQDQVPSHDLGAAEYHKRFRERERQHVQKKAAQLGDQRSPAEPIPQE